MVVAAAAALYYQAPQIFQKKVAEIPQQNETSESSGFVQPGTEPTSEQSKAAAVRNAKIVFPVVESVNRIERAGLPKDLNVFIRADAEGISASGVNYEKGAKGFRVVYSAASVSASDYFQELSEVLSGSSWRFLGGTLTDAFSYYELENGEYQVRVSLTPAGADRLGVEAEILRIVK